MPASTAVRQSAAEVRRGDRIAGACLLVGGAAFVAGGATHPGDSGTGSKVHQLHEMLVDPMWYPSHALLLLAMVAYAIAILRVLRGGGLDRSTARVARVVAVVAVVAAVGMTVHLLSALGADGIADGTETFAYRLQAVNESIVDASWGLSIAALAAAGGLTRTLGNPVTAALGLVGGLAFALASATIAYTDRFDGLFPVGSLVGLWGVVVGLMMLSAAHGLRAVASGE